MVVKFLASWKPFVEDTLLRLTAVYIAINSTRLVLQVIARLRFLRKQEGSKSSQYLRSFLGVLRIIVIFIAVIVNGGQTLRVCPFHFAHL